MECLDFLQPVASGDGEDQANELDLPTSDAVAELEGDEGEEGEEGAEGDEQLEDLEPFQGSQGSPLNDLDCSSESPTSPTLPGGGGFDDLGDFKGWEWFMVLNEAYAFQDVQDISRHIVSYSHTCLIIFYTYLFHVGEALADYMIG